jgi:alkanesulfonate monooxygenase SsuD/methylene tetrahydromethanopterin reductase-like flavin-dependent oxidoreductase (luciferase family)
MALPPPPTTVAQVTDYVTKEDFARLVAQINALTMAQGAPQGAVAQMAVPTPPTASPPPLIVGGQQCPEGYVFVGTHHHGVAIWGSVDTVTASMMENEAAGNDEVM